MKLPTSTAIKAFHKSQAPNEKTFQDIYSHCQIVAEIAAEIIENSKLAVNQDLVRVGALLHDVGGYTFDDLQDAFRSGTYVTHAVRGYDLLKKNGFDEEICRITLNHIGVGVTKQNIKELNLPIPLQDYTPQTLEQELVTYADKFHSKVEGGTFNSPEWYTKKVIKFGLDQPKKFEVLVQKFGLPNIKALSKKYNQSIRDL